ncbi:MAG: hypothetical protein IJ532_04385 [Alphaproteobacteria bacterium]|nr:hypothetical protein [Alphaproteobacteria bacterium]
MQFSDFGHIFVYNNTEQNLAVLQNVLSSGIYQTFTTGNIYQFLQYAKELSPDLMIFNLDDEKKYSEETGASFNQQIRLTNFPIVLTKPHNQKFSVHSRVAHYIHLPLEIAKLQDIMESYCLGHKNHQILFLSEYRPQYDRLHRSLDIGGYTYFEVHNLEAAEIYLSKNNPQTVFVEYNPKLLTARHHLQHNRIFYVDRQQDITEIEKFLN